jgi:hypothetical protein
MGWWSGGGVSQRPYFLNARCAFGRGNELRDAALLDELQSRCQGNDIKAGSVMAWASQPGQIRVSHQR